MPFEVEPLLDDVRIGDLEGASIDEYRAWKRAHSRRDAFPNGESLEEAAVRYGRGLDAVLARPERGILVVAHEIPVRYALNAAEGSRDPDSPHHEIANATPYLFGEERLAEAAARLATPAPAGTRQEGSRSGSPETRLSGAGPAQTPGAAPRAGRTTSRVGENPLTTKWR